MQCQTFSPQTFDKYICLDCVGIDKRVRRAINNMLNNVSESQTLRVCVSLEVVCVCEESACVKTKSLRSAEILSALKVQ